VILVTIVSNWSQLLTGKQTAKASSFASEAIAVQDATLMLKTELAASSNYRERIIVKNITSNTDAILTGYKILVSENPNDYNFLNTRIDFNSEVTILAGFKNSIEIVCFPSRKFDLLLYTNRNTSDKITVNVNTYDKLSCAQHYSYLNPPTINVTELTTSNTAPDLNGLISNTSATLSLILDGTTYTPTNDKDGTWSLTDVNELSSGSYDVNICATDIYGLVTCDESDTNELEIESIPLPSIDVSLQSGEVHWLDIYEDDCGYKELLLHLESNVSEGGLYVYPVGYVLTQDAINCGWCWDGGDPVNFVPNGYISDISSSSFDISVGRLAFCHDGLVNEMGSWGDLNVCVTNETGTGCDTVQYSVLAD